jgi:hypothetical protein
MSPSLGQSDERYFRCLDYVFGVQCDDAAASSYIRTILGPFEFPSDGVQRRVPPTPNVPPIYSLVQGGEDWDLLYGRELLFGPRPLDDVVCHLSWHINAEIGRVTGSYLLIHAGAVVSPTGNALMLPGDSGSGKTTLVAALLGSGFGYLSDEIGAIDPFTRQIYAYPKSLTLKRGSFGLFPELNTPHSLGVARLQEQWLVQPAVLGSTVVAGPCPVRWIVNVHYESGAATQLERISRGATILELGSRVMNMPHYGRRALPLLADLVRGADTYRLVSGDLAEAVDTIEGLGSDSKARGQRPIAPGSSIDDSVT